MDENDIALRKAQALVNACNGIGLSARLHQDRSPWMCHVALVDVPRMTDVFDENTPGLFFYVEDHRDFHILSPLGTNTVPVGWKWHASILVDREIPEQDDINDITIQVIERTWLGDDEHTVAQKIVLLHEMIDITQGAVTA